MRYFKAFFGAFFGVLGAAFALGVVLLGIGILAAISDDDSLGSGTKILPDAHAHRKELGSHTPVLLQINLQGQVGKGDLTAKKVRSILQKSRENKLKNDRVKGILLIINSPGGGVNASDQIYRALDEYKKQTHIPIYAYVDGMCASGGYYAALSADKIYATEVSLIGSVGVLAWPPFVNVSEPLKKWGISSLTLSAGKGKDELNPLRPWKTDEQDHYQKLINFYYKRFVSLVVKHRPKLTETSMVSEYGAEVFPAPKAMELGFIDKSNATRSEVLTALAQAAGIGEEEKYQVIAFETKNWWRRAMKQQSPLVTGRVTHEFHLSSQERDNPFFYQFR